MFNIVLCIPVAMPVAMPVVMATLVMVLDEVWLLRLIFVSLYFPVPSTSPGFNSIWSLSIRSSVCLLICLSVRPHVSFLAGGLEADYGCARLCDACVLCVLCMRACVRACVRV